MVRICGSTALKLLPFTRGQLPRSPGFDRAYGRHGSQVELFHRILDQLVADEARILGALSDGSPSPLVNVHAWANVPPSRRNQDGLSRPSGREGRQAHLDDVRPGQLPVGGGDAEQHAVSADLVVAIQSWHEIKRDFGANWLIYLSMPLVAAFVGWSTKIVALEMLYRPLEFKGIGPIGWQGILPRGAGQVGSKTIELLTANLLKPEELLDRIDAQEAVEALRDPLVQAVDEISRDLAEQIRPGLWDALPDAARKAIQSRIHNQAPRITENLLNEMKSDLSRYVDVQFLAVTTLVRNKDKLVKLMRGLGDNAMAFVRRSGIYFGFGIGLVQMFAWALFKNPWIMPAFGFGVGLI